VGHAGHGIAAILFDVPLANNAVTAFKLDRAENDGLPLVGDLSGHVALALTADGHQGQQAPSHGRGSSIRVNPVLPRRLGRIMAGSPLPKGIAFAPVAGAGSRQDGATK